MFKAFGGLRMFFLLKATFKASHVNLSTPTPQTYNIMKFQ
jgi:hypothetical protein